MALPEIVYIDVSESGCDLRTLLDNLLKICDSKYELKIDCKYYSADIIIRSVDKLCALSKSPEFLNVHGVIICFSGDKVSSWNDALKLMGLAISHDVSIRMLVCHTVNPSILFSSEPDAFSVMTRIILDHEFELVEISPNEDTIEEDQNNRNHSKSITNNKSLNNENHLNLVNNLSNNINKIHLNNNNNEYINSSLNNESEFEELFKQLPIIRNEIASLNSTDRYNMAEKITCKIWRAIGGSEEEISGLQHSDSD
uniref:Alpha-and gamma-adaptin-binding protein p34 n=1 Tax=Schistosoma haematobium TaxID=6185 RepID=A0A095AHM9_SCHHA